MKTKYITKSAMIATLYIILTYITNLFGLANGAIQIRISEALTILPCFTVAAIPGLAIGCLVSNVITGCTVLDIVFGTIATLIGAIGTYMLRKYKYIAVLPPIVSNTVIIPCVLIYATGISVSFWYVALTVCIGEFISCGLFGIYLYNVLKKKNSLFE